MGLGLSSVRKFLTAEMGGYLGLFLKYLKFSDFFFKRDVP
ncbi:hypothetical protein BLL52_0346 [Rhodoferax antarcticus ANT.BR]|uniref:Uncharacterized protein n=1 Tax=Rhodoferax antarcticus ANT.BR TaxID=1111071 RepID=A0A1Q8YJW1_9BURK|nr:hypothetical protein BLL52_0346 [Rhodoferax antarcticus ANT.BR]